MTKLISLGFVVIDGMDRESPIRNLQSSTPDLIYRRLYGWLYGLTVTHARVTCCARARARRPYGPRGALKPIPRRHRERDRECRHLQTACRNCTDDATARFSRTLTQFFMKSRMRLDFQERFYLHVVRLYNDAFYAMLRTLNVTLLLLTLTLRHSFFRIAGRVATTSNAFFRRRELSSFWDLRDAQKISV